MVFLPLHFRLVPGGPGAGYEFLFEAPKEGGPAYGRTEYRVPPGSQLGIPRGEAANRYADHTDYQGGT